MGVVMCKVHTRSGMAHVCTHVRDAVRAGRPPPAFTIVEVDFEPEILELGFCAACVERHALPARITAEQWEAEKERFHTEPVCGRCLRASVDT